MYYTSQPAKFHAAAAVSLQQTGSHTQTVCKQSVFKASMKSEGELS